MKRQELRDMFRNASLADAKQKWPNMPRKKRRAMARKSVKALVAMARVHGVAGTEER